MRHSLTSSRKHLIFDLDGVHYPYDAFEDITAFCADIKGRIAPAMLDCLTREDAMALGKKSYLETGDGLHYFIMRAVERGYEMEPFRNELHERYHRIQWEKFNAQYPHLLHPCDETNRLFARIAPHTNNALLTQSCLVTWAVPLLSAQEKIGFFNQSALAGFKESGWHLKKSSTEPLRLIMERIGASAHETVFIEDNLDNLQTAKKLNGDILTVYLCNGKPKNPVPDFVDIQTPNLKSFFNIAASVYDATPKRAIHSDAEISSKPAFSI